MFRRISRLPWFGVTGDKPPRAGEAGGKKGFFRALDSFQCSFYKTLSRHYANRHFCKLVAMKVSNLFAADFHFHHRHSMLASLPVQLLIDPANGCQLACPGCVHSGNPAWSRHFDWPSATLSVTDSRDFFDKFGIFASSAVFYNYGEPLLHRKLPDIIRAAKQYLLFTIVSTNLGLRLDAEALVLSGLDRLVLSIDGASQSVYEQYRRAGRLALVTENIKAIVESRKRFGRNKPYVVWQFLTFEHNVAEVGRAIEMARDLGVNEISIRTPFDVGLDDPSIKPATSPLEGRIVFEPWDSHWCTEEEIVAVAERAFPIGAAFKKSWQERYVESGGTEEPSRAESATCQWLYHNVTMDAARRVMPCCIPPRSDKNAGNLVYAHFGPHNEVVNSSSALLARYALANRQPFPGDSAGNEAVSSNNLPYCVTCVERPIPPFHFNVPDYIYEVDIKRIISPAIYEALRECRLYTATG